ncbi:MAG: GNAT family N-acetyltransferase [bacterium]|nr:GNAT family N-acetyltransferase [Gammaproteobacteria bacterium]HIL95054.1 GNAT family N-acetyltransferase [Pseudomonadales bacterium]
MKPELDFQKPPFSESFLGELLRIFQLVFPAGRRDYLMWRLENMPNVTVFTSAYGKHLTGFKAGYAFTESRYYSWLGGVDTVYRNQGIAKKLMSQQHRWLLGSVYSLVETHVEQSNKAMVQLNHNSGLVITGHFVKDGKPNYIMQKNVRLTDQ